MNSPTVTIRLPSEMLEAVDTLANNQGVTRSAIIQDAIASKLSHQAALSPFIDWLGLPKSDQDALEVLSTRQGYPVETLINQAIVYYIDYHKGLGVIHSMLKQLRDGLVNHSFNLTIASKKAQDTEHLP